MDPKWIKTSLRLIGKIYRDILDDSYNSVIPAAIESVDVTKKAYDWGEKNKGRLGREPEPWGYTIYHNDPLRFISTTVPNSVELQVDVYCDIRWTEDDVPVQQDIKVRIWTQHADIIFREAYDSEKIFDEFEDEARLHFPRLHKKSRVISRFHFDKANPGQGGPNYHLQLGGVPQPYELCWHPEKVNVPRLEYQPMDLFLTCQMIVANFFPKEYLEIRKKSEWRGMTLWCQKQFLKEYYRQCFEAVDNNKVLLDKLWVH
ncbi:MAG: hypothetical protein GY797_34845 [Deltaproteobacteria bacterium]|nr:hypothetical protein [Deltaproteobacteria bacterium]